MKSVLAMQAQRNIITASSQSTKKGHLSSYPTPSAACRGIAAAHRRRGTRRRHPQSQEAEARASRLPMLLHLRITSSLTATGGLGLGSRSGGSGDQRGGCEGREHAELESLLRIFSGRTRRGGRRRVGHAGPHLLAMIEAKGSSDLTRNGDAARRSAGGGEAGEGLRVREWILKKKVSERVRVFLTTWEFFSFFFYD